MLLFVRFSINRTVLLTPYVVGGEQREEGP